MMGYYEGDWGAGQWVAMSAMMLLFWGTLIAVAVYAVSVFQGRNPREGAGDADVSGTDRVLAERFARGEIDEAEFLHSRDLLHSISARP